MMKTITKTYFNHKIHKIHMIFKRLKKIYNLKLKKKMKTSLPKLKRISQ